MKHRKLLAILVTLLLTFACCFFTACGSDLAASASGTYSSESLDEQDAEGPEGAVEDAEDPEVIVEEDAVEAEEEGEDLELEAEVLNEQMVWITEKGKCYHSKSTCSNMKNPAQVPISQVGDRYACPKCKP